MAGYKGHIAGGAVLGIAYLFVVLVFYPLGSFALGRLDDWQFFSVLMVVSMLFALWPDIDTNSKGQDIFFAVAFILDIGLIMLGYLEAAAYLGLLAMTPIVGKHRGWTHNKLAMLLVPIPGVLVTYIYKPEAINLALIVYGAAVTGYFSHLLLDGKITKRFKIRSRSY